MTDEQLAIQAFTLVQKWNIERAFCDSANQQSIERLRRAGGHAMGLGDVSGSVVPKPVNKNVLLYTVTRALLRHYGGSTETNDAPSM